MAWRDRLLPKVKIMHSFGPQDQDVRYEISKGSLFPDRSEKIHSKDLLFTIVEHLFQCTRMEIEAFPNPESQHSYFHVFLELSPGVFWRNFDARLQCDVILRLFPFIIALQGANNTF